MSVLPDETVPLPAKRAKRDTSSPGPSAKGPGWKEWEIGGERRSHVRKTSIERGWSCQ